MSEANSSQKSPRCKPTKPPGCPLTVHPAGYWSKKIRGRVCYFGPWEDLDGALARYQAEKDALAAGQAPEPDREENLTVKGLVNAFLNHKQNMLDAGELSPRTFADYLSTGQLVAAQFGKTRLVSSLKQGDFAGLRRKMAQKWGPVRVGNVITRVRCLFKYAYDADLIDKPVRYGPGFKRPSKKTLRLERARQGPRLFTALEIRRLVDAANPALRAMILLGINCGFGNSDCGNLPLKAVSLETGWISYPRPKTGIPRRCPLWPETVAAIKEALDRRPEPKDEAAAELVFVTVRGLSWAKDTADSPITKETAKLLKALHINGRKGLGFYTLRHVFETVGGESKDQVAVDHVMGHARDDMASVYREGISDERLRAVAEHVHRWLFGAVVGSPVE
jgi:integrase